MLPGITVKPLHCLADERGFFTEILRIDWKDFLAEDSITQANFSLTYPDIVRAWHRHEKDQTDYFIVIRGASKICAYDEKKKELDEIVSTEKTLQIVKIPGNYWHGFKAFGQEPTYIIYFVTKLYNYENPDEIRKPWNDRDIMPKKINGRTDDPRCGKPWNWLTPPHK